MVTIEIDVISDFQCVWCYIGKKQLERAISLYQRVYPGAKHDVFSITYRPYFLNRGAITQSVEKSQLMTAKFAGTSEEKKKALMNRVCQVGQSVGIEFRWGGKLGPTREAHRLVYLSRDKPADVQERLLEGIFSAYHEKEEDIATEETLCRIAVEAGLDGDEVNGWLASDAGLEGLLAEEKAFREMRDRTGVPAYRVQGLSFLEGSQDLQDLMDLFIKIRESDEGQLK